MNKYVPPNINSGLTGVRPPILACLAVLFLLSLTNIAFSQTNKPNVNNEQDDDAVIKVTTLNIGLPVSVFDEQGNFVDDLKRENFQVLENNEVQPIVEFHSDKDLSLNVAILMDTSTSVRSKLEFEKVALKQFLASVFRTDKDNIAFITFDNAITLRSPFTNDIKQVSKTIDEIKTASGQTSLYDAIYKTCKETMASTKGRRRVLVIVTDGADTSSSHTIEQTIALAQATETTIYTLSTKGGSIFREEDSEYANNDDREIKRICKETGGQVFFPDDIDSLTEAFQDVISYLRSQYIIVYEPTNTTQIQRRRIEVKVVGRNNLSTITRQGYLAK